MVAQRSEVTAEKTAKAEHTDLPEPKLHQVIAPDGTQVRELPDIDRDTMLKIYRTMSLIRALDERMMILQRQGRIDGTVAVGIDLEKRVAAGPFIAKLSRDTGECRSADEGQARDRAQVEAIRGRIEIGDPAEQDARARFRQRDLGQRRGFGERFIADDTRWRRQLDALCRRSKSATELP